MRQALITAPWTVGFVDVGVPDVGPGEVLVRVKAVGLCTLEQRVYRGARPEYPFLGGHEVGGVVVRSPSQRFPQDTIVAVSTFPRCGICELCVNGLDNLCGYVNRSKARNKEPWGPGGLAAYMSIRERYVFPVSGSVIAASLVEPLACVLHSISRARLAQGDSVVIFGFGVMGALHVIAATEIGLLPVWAELHGSGSPDRRLAKSATEFVNIFPDALRAALAFKRLRPKAAYCIRGGAEAIKVACTIVAPGGTVVDFASPINPSTISIDRKEMRSKEVRICASVNHTLSDFAEAARMAGGVADRLEELVAERFPLSSVREALSRAVQTDLGRIIVEP